MFTEVLPWLFTHCLDNTIFSCMQIMCQAARKITCPNCFWYIPPPSRVFIHGKHSNIEQRANEHFFVGGPRGFWWTLLHLRTAEVAGGESLIQQACLLPEWMVFIGVWESEYGERWKECLRLWCWELRWKSCKMMMTLTLTMMICQVLTICQDLPEMLYMCYFIHLTTMPGDTDYYIITPNFWVRKLRLREFK